MDIDSRTKALEESVESVRRKADERIERAEKKAAPDTGTSKDN